MVSWQKKKHLSSLKPECNISFSPDTHHEALTPLEGQFSQRYWCFGPISIFCSYHLEIWLQGCVIAYDQGNYRPCSSIYSTLYLTILFLLSDIHHLSVSCCLPILFIFLFLLHLLRVSSQIFCTIVCLGLSVCRRRLFCRATLMNHVDSKNDNTIHISHLSTFHIFVFLFGQRFSINQS